MDEISDSVVAEARVFQDGALERLPAGDWASRRPAAWPAANARSALAAFRPLEPMPDWQKVSFPPTEAARPEGEWRLREEVYVAGLHHHRESVNSFFEAAWAELLPLNPIELVRRPAAHKGATLIAVFGRYYDTPPLKRTRRDEPVEHLAPLGHLPFEVAAEFAELAPDTPLTAELRECAWLPGEPESKVVMLALWAPERAPLLNPGSIGAFRRFGFKARAGQDPGEARP